MSNPNSYIIMAIILCLFLFGCRAVPCYTDSGKIQQERMGDFDMVCVAREVYEHSAGGDTYEVTAMWSDGLWIRYFWHSDYEEYVLFFGFSDERARDDVWRRVDTSTLFDPGRDHYLHLHYPMRWLVYSSHGKVEYRIWDGVIAPSYSSIFDTDFESFVSEWNNITIALYRAIGSNWEDIQDASEDEIGKILNRIGYDSLDQLYTSQWFLE